MKRWMFGFPTVGMLIFACSGAGDQSNSDDKTGTLKLELTGIDSAGEVYRLRNASFHVMGYPHYYFPTSGGAGGSEGYYYETTLSTETNPNAAQITQRVVPGSYYVTFDTGQDWYMEHITPSGPERVAQAVLLSEPTQFAYVYDRGTTPIFYNIGVNGRTIDFRYGDIQIRIGVEQPGDGAGGFPGTGGAGGAFF